MWIDGMTLSDGEDQEERARELRARDAGMDWDQTLAYTLTQTTQAFTELEPAAQP
jgi:hypothetical protein